MADLLPDFSGRVPDEPSLDDEAVGPWRERMIGALSAFVVAAEVNPWTHDVLKLAVAGALGVATKDPVWVAAFMTGSTMAYEGLGALGTAWLLGTEHGSQLTVRTHELLHGAFERLSRNHIDLDNVHDVPPAAAALVALVLGTPALMVLRQVVDPARTTEQNRNYGLAVATGVSATVGTESWAAASGIVNVDPRFIGVAVVGLVTLLGTAAWGVRQLRDEGPLPPLELDAPPEE